MAKPELEFFDPTCLAEHLVGGIAGLTERILRYDPETGGYTRMLQFAPGTDTSPMGVQQHDIWEEIWIREGSIHGLSLNRTFVAGMYACRPPGMPHGPCRSANGYRTLESRYYLVKNREESCPWHAGVESKGLSIDAFVSLEVERSLRSHRLIERESV